MAAKYGITYQGSKDAIADSIITFLPPGERFVDLFGGGFSMSECALKSGKYKSVYYNELNPLLVELIKKAIAGEYNLDRFKPEFITYEEFNKLKNTDGYIKYLWSFSASGDNYYLMRRVQHIAKEGHDYAVFGKPIKGLPLRTDGTVRQRRVWLYRKCKLERAKMIKKEPTLLPLYKKYQDTIKCKTKAGKKLAAQFGAWLRSTGITAKEVNTLTRSFMASHYLCDKEDGQPAIPTDEMWAKLKQSPKLKNIPEEIELLCDSTKRIEKLLKEQSREMQERLERLEINCGSYQDYEYRTGDVVYCDPPYEDTAGYNDDGFDHKAFYDWVASRPFKVYFSSYNNISDKRFKMVWAKPKRSLMCGAGGKTNYECIYTNEV